MQTAWYVALAVPRPLTTAIDFYISKPLFDLFAPKFDASDFALRDRLGGGNFGIVYEAVMKRRALPLNLFRSRTYAKVPRAAHHIVWHKVLFGCAACLLALRRRQPHRAEQRQLCMQAQTRTSRGASSRVTRRTAAWC